MSRALARVRNLADLQHLARRRLPAPMRDYIDGGADDEWTMRRNTAAFDDWTLVQRPLVDVATIDTGTTLLGMRSTLPLMLSPTGMSQLFHRDGELAVARAAAAAGVPYSLSTMATTGMASVAETGVARAFQLYLFRDRGLTEALLSNAALNGFDALILTVDTPVAGNRERDLRTGMTMPPRFGARSLLSFAAHPRWAIGALSNKGFKLANIVDHVGDLGNDTTVIDYVNRQFDRSATWSDVAWLRARWKGRLAIKGLMTAADCAEAVAQGAEAIMVSNHGGRQLDGTAAPVECLAAIRDRIGSAAQLICDGGVRRGTHILKALALGADGCSIGRPYLHGLAASGEAGVTRALDLIRAEIVRSMALIGRTRVADVSATDVQRVGIVAS
ncbi:alpha-hydroxy acid oxidase [Sphingomonas sp. Y38-1Y]|uniref:alpha-hydroxy acid oxidase n=1 Tax=Sphingomonas sp. Y38-1Y TaxID=3078265 RepID=UPI0028E2132D|nr:alpha-hydroxy acid oxidase [Sphingomonas sp. Y38-1Y]